MRLATLLAAAALALLAPAAGARGSDPSPLEGRWKTRAATTEQLIAHATWPSAAHALARLHVRIPAVDLRDGRARWFDLATGKTFCIGTYLVHGDRVGFALSSSCVGPVRRGVTWMHWTLFRDRLTFSALPGRAPLSPIAIYPWVRVS
jgi:hypothetical protein